MGSPLGDRRSDTRRYRRAVDGGLSCQSIMVRYFCMTESSVDVPRVRRKDDLFALAADRGGIFTAASARAIGVSPTALAYYVRSGAIERFGRGVYRVTHFPKSRHEPLVTAAAALGINAVVSHESALALYGVCDVAPSRIHLTVPRSRRYRRPPAPDIVVHTATRAFSVGDVVQFDGFKATSLVRSIVDSARTHTAPEQVVMALRSGLERGLFTSADVARARDSTSARVRALIDTERSR